MKLILDEVLPTEHLLEKQELIVRELKRDRCYHRLTSKTRARKRGELATIRSIIAKREAGSYL